MKGLVSAGFLKPLPNQEVCVLHTPLIIEFSSKASKAIQSHYNPDHEIGGVALALPMTKNGNRVLLVNNVAFLENLSSTPERQFYRPEMRDDIRRIWKDNSKEDGVVYIPLFFHSHPTIGLEDMNSINRLISSLAPLGTSEADQRFSLALQLSMNGDRFLIPNALVVQSRIPKQNLVIGFFGGGITPTDFSDYLVKVTGKTVKSVLKGLHGWVEEDPIRIWVLVLLGGIVAVPLILYPKKAIPFVFVLILILLGSQIIPIAEQATESLPNYFAIVKSEGTTVRIPQLQ